MNILIPCAGQAKRFQEAGFKEIKPFIKTKGKYMIEWVIKNMLSDIHKQTFTFLFQKEHVENYNVLGRMANIAREYGIICNIVPIDGLTEGSASTILRAKNKIDLDEPLIIANSDQYISKFDVDRFVGWATKDDCTILAFNATDSKWSYVEPADHVHVMSVKEKEPVSNIANTGIFSFKEGRDAMWAIEEMISKNIRVGNEFYLAPAINELVEDNGYVTYKLLETYQKMWGLGTPFDHKIFEENYK